MWGWVFLTAVLLWPGGGGSLGVEATDQCTDRGNQTTPTALPLTPPGDGIMQWIYELNKVFMEDMIKTESWVETFSDESDEDGKVLMKILQHFQGYIIVAIVGIAFTILLPIAGCCFCCCRTCCCCCCKKKTKKSNVKRKACGSFFSVFVVLLAIGVSFAMAAACFVSAQFEEANGVFQTLSQSIKGLDRFANSTSKSLWTLKDNTIDPSLTKVRKQVTELPTTTHHDLGEKTRAAPLYTQLEVYTENLEKSVVYFESMKIQTSDLESKRAVLEVELGSFKSNVSTQLTGCSDQACKDIINKSNTLDVNVDFSSVSDTGHAVHNMSTSLTGPENITASVDLGTNVWNGIGELIANASEDSTKDIDKSISDLTTEIDDALKETTDAINEISTGKLGKSMDDIGEDLGKFSPYILYALLALCSVPLLVTMFYLLGMMFGFIGNPPGKGRFCSTGKGACCLMCGISFTFLLAWLIMLVVTILFLIGSVMHNELCRQLLNPAESEDLQFLFDHITNNSSQLDIQYTLESCQENDALYTALNIDELFPNLNITKLLDLSQFDFDGLLDDLTNVNVTTGHITLMNNITKMHLHDLNNGYKTVDFKTYHDALQKDITNTDLNTFADFMKEKSKDIPDRSIRNKINTILLPQVRAIHQNHVNGVQSGMKNLQDSTDGAEMFVNSLDIERFIPSMTSAQTQLDNNALQTSLRTAATAIYGEIEELTTNMDSAVRCDIGNCQELTNMLSGSVTVLCVHLLHPLNALWFGLGWCLMIMVIPLLFVAVSLIDQWRVSSVAPVGDDMEMGEYDGRHYKRKPNNKVHPTEKKLMYA